MQINGCRWKQWPLVKCYSLYLSRKKCFQFGDDFWIVSYAGTCSGGWWVHIGTFREMLGTLFFLFWQVIKNNFVINWIDVCQNAVISGIDLLRKYFFKDYSNLAKHWHISIFSLLLCQQYLNDIRYSHISSWEPVITFSCCLWAKKLMKIAQFSTIFF